MSLCDHGYRNPERCPACAPARSLDRTRPARSVYADRSAPSSARMVTAHGMIVGYQLDDGTMVEEPDCCEDPRECERPECWRPLWP